MFGSRCLFLLHASTLSEATRACECVLQAAVAGHADLQCTAAEGPCELSGWELVLDWALSELLSKLFPDNMHTHTHTDTYTDTQIHRQNERKQTTETVKIDEK